MDKNQLRELIEETLKEINLYSEDAVNLLMGTAAQESHLGVYIRQLGCGVAQGIFQMEAATLEDIKQNYLSYRPELSEIILKACNSMSITPDSLRWNLKLATCMARVHYLRVDEPLPDDLQGYAEYWKKYYNSYLGKGSTSEFIHNYKTYVL